MSGMAVYFEEEKSKDMDRKVKVGEVALRFATLVFGAAAVAIIVTNAEVREIIPGVEETAKFSYVKAMVFLVIANGLAAAFSLVQLVRCLANLLRGIKIHSRVVAWVIFISDQLMSYMTLSALSATMQAAVVTEYGQPEFQWRKTCSLFKRFCFRSGEGTALAFVVSLGSICNSGISAFNLFRLYDNSII